MRLPMIAVQPIEVKQLGNLNLRDMMRISNAFAGIGFMVSPLEAGSLWTHRSAAWDARWIPIDEMTDGDIIDQIARHTKPDAAVVIVASDEEGYETKFFPLSVLNDVASIKRQ